MRGYIVRANISRMGYPPLLAYSAVVKATQEFIQERIFIFNFFPLVAQINLSPSLVLSRTHIHLLSIPASRSHPMNALCAAWRKFHGR